MTSLRDRNDLPLLRADDLADDILADLAGLAADRVAERHGTFSRSNLLAEVHRQLHGIRFASPDHRVAVAERTTDLALGAAVQVAAPELHHVHDRYRRPDGTSRLRPADHRLYTTEALLDAEQRLLHLGHATGSPTVSVGTVARVCEANLPGRDNTMTTDQALAVEKIATSGRVLDVLVGPVGTGKSTTMATLCTERAPRDSPSDDCRLIARGLDFRTAIYRSRVVPSGRTTNGLRSSPQYSG